MLDAIAEAGPGLKAPTQKYIYDAGLDEEYDELKGWVNSFKNVWKERGCTIMCDGWIGTTRKSMIKFLVYYCEGTIFLKSVDASNNIKNVDYLFRLMDDAVEEVGEENVVQVVTDNEASYKAVGYFFNPRIQYKDNVHNDGEVMRGTMTIITRLARTMNERLDAMAEVERYRMKLGTYGGYDMRCAAQRLTPGYLHAWVFA
ncbi:hypothetical protein Taro_000700 [Colocasia esculenta]|uniref:DUF659 domain-containing protein n=1 Tax=Colocasia esculenta TaxID=4460 RepID=A0A843TBK0_COLES|nr:hypothetical protein [Colocasia esculenta]